MKKISIALIFLATFTFSLVAQTKKPVAKPVQKAPVKAVAKKPAPAPSIQASIAKGKAVYMTYCIACHQADASGVPNLNPPLIKTAYVSGDKAKLIGVVLKGMQNVEIDGDRYSNVMPPHNFLTDQQIADVLTYVRNSFGNKYSQITMAEVKAVRAKTK